LLQLATALHFALVPHGFSAGLNGFVHVHAALSAEPASTKRALHQPSDQPSLVSHTASCSTESCPLGFAGAQSVLLARAGVPSVLELARAPQMALSPRAPVSRSRALLNAPKTSPPICV
jgi:hypothetical protein